MTQVSLERLTYVRVRLESLTNVGGRTHYIWVSYRGGQFFAFPGEFFFGRRLLFGKKSGGDEFADRTTALPSYLEDSMRALPFDWFRGFNRQFSTWLTASLIILLLCANANAADRPSAMKLFPHDSLVFIRMANAHEFAERFQETSMARMIRDPQLKPFVDHLYGKAGDLYAEHVEGKVGVTWDDLKNLPQGEVAFAVVAREHQPPALLLLVDQGKEASVADKLLDKALDFADQSGGEFTKEKIGDVEVTVVRDHDNQKRSIGVFERDNTIVVATDPNVIRDVLWHWDHPGEQPPSVEAALSAKSESSGDKDSKNKEAEFVPGRTLAENVNFATVLRECRRKQDPPPHLIFFADPIGLVRNLGRDNGGMQFALGLLPSLGVDGLIGAGGAITYATDEYNDLTQVHILLENPRAGVMQLPAFEPGDTVPQAFVPQSVQSYMAWHWKLRTTYDRLAALVDQYRYKGSVDKFVKEKISDKLGIDVLTQIIDNLKGRYTWMIGFDRPARMQGGQHMLAAELVDEKAVEEALKTVIGKFPDLFEERHFGSATYYAIMPKRLRERPEEERPANPFVGIMEGYLFVGGSCQQFERCIAARDGTEPRLVDSDDYVRTNAVIGRETAGTAPVMFALGRSEEALRQWYDLLTSPKTREQLNENKGKNPFFAALAETLEQNELPPFDVLKPYMAPGGGILYDTDSGYHGISFTLRNKAEQ